MIVTMPTRPVTTPANPHATPPPCGMNGLACAGNCGNCPAARPASTGMGAFYDDFPAPFNNPLILAAIAVVVLLVFGGGLKLFGGRSSGGGRRRAKLRLIQAKAQEERARLLAS